MSEPDKTKFQVRGYMISAAAAILRDTAGEREANRIFEAFSPQTRETLASAKPASWGPAESLSEIFTAVAALGQRDEQRTRELLIGTGGRMGREATNTFLRLFIRMLSPALLAKKVPDLWSRDCTGGRLVTEVSEKKIVCRIYDTYELAHSVCIIPGFVKFALETAGANIESVTIHGWSLDTPRTKEASCEFLLK